jgi:chromate transporter
MNEMAHGQLVEGEPAAGVPSALVFLRAWVGIGVQSFGGGSTTLYLMRREMVERRGWITDDEFTRTWGMVQIVPGINLIGQSIVIGWHVLGALGVALALAGLLLPSVTITVLLTAAYSTVRELPVIAAVLRGVVPATVGLGLLLALQMARAPLAASRTESRASLAFSVALLVASAVLAGLGGLPVLVVLWGAGALCALAVWRTGWRRP